jgi:hypothetical protein
VFRPGGWGGAAPPPGGRPGMPNSVIATFPSR